MGPVAILGVVVMAVVGVMYVLRRKNRLKGSH